VFLVHELDHALLEEAQRIVFLELIQPFESR